MQGKNWGAARTQEKEERKNKILPMFTSLSPRVEESREYRKAGNIISVHLSPHGGNKGVRKEDLLSKPWNIDV